MRTLICHPASPCSFVHRFSAQMEKVGLEGWRLVYVLEGEMDKLKLPSSPRAPAEQGVDDPLWRHTCCEAFMRPVGGSAYTEFNFSPSGAWARYDFADYRALRPSSVPGEGTCGPPFIQPDVSSGVLRVDVSLPHAPLALPLEVGLSGVVEGVDGSLSYWALHHPVAKPDFHHSGSFALKVAA